MPDIEDKTQENAEVEQVDADQTEAETPVETDAPVAQEEEVAVEATETPDADTEQPESAEETETPDTPAETPEADEEEEMSMEEIEQEADATRKQREEAKAHGAKWYVLSTRSGYEKKAAKLIEQRVKAGGLEDQVIQVVVPTQEKTVAKAGKKKTVEERIFPGYVLVNMILNDATWYIVRNTEGVTGFVGASKKPSPLSEDEVKAILAFTEVKQTSYESAYRIGDAIKVTDGPFKDLIGNIKEINEDKGQLTVLLSMFGREVPVQLDFLQVTSL